MVSIVLVVSSVAGRFILYWRRKAADGFGLGRTNVPAILWSGVGQIVVWLVGQALCWGAVVALLVWDSWQWSVAALVLGFVLQRPLLRIVCASDLTSARAFQTDGDRPSLERLGDLNPLLLAKPRDEIEALLDEIQKCGYIWDESEKCFRHPEIGVRIRTQGLDLFTPERFRQDHDKIYLQYTSDPDAYWERSSLMYRWRKWGPRLILVGVADALLGWAVLPVEIWLTSLGIVVALFVLLARQARAVGEQVWEETMDGVEQDAPE